MSEPLLSSPTASTDNALSALLIQLLKGVVYEEQHAKYWPDLLRMQAAIRDYCRVIGLALYIDEAEGYAFLRQQDPDSEEDDGADIPRLIPRRSLSFSVSLLLVLLRKRLAEEDAGGGETRVMLSKDQIVDMMQLFMPEQKNEARVTESIGIAINKAVEYGFLRKLKQDEGEVLEIRRILKAFVDAQWLDDFQVHLDGYREHVGSE